MDRYLLCSVGGQFSRQVMDVGTVECYLILTKVTKPSHLRSIFLILCFDDIDVVSTYAHLSQSGVSWMSSTYLNKGFFAKGSHATVSFPYQMESSVSLQLIKGTQT